MEEYLEVSLGALAPATSTDWAWAFIAGGYDALFLLVLDPSSPPIGSANPLTEIERIWGSWTELSVCPLSSRADAGGLRWYESVASVEGLGEACGW